MEEAVYARQSVEKKNSISIEGQIELCRKAASGNLSVYRDRGYSGKNTERPDFQRLLRDIQAGKISKVYVYRLDRFSRSVADFGRLWEVLQEHHVEFVSVSENFDTTTPMGRAMLHIIMVFAQLERETTAERVKDNYYRRAQLGAWPGGPAPFGYSIGRANGADGRTIPTLIPSEYADYVVRIFNEYAVEGASLGSVAKRLNEEGVPSPKRGTWDNVALSRVLHNPTYVMADEQVYLHYKGLGCTVTASKEAFDGVHGVLLVGKRDRSKRKYTDVREHSVSVLNSIGIIPADVWLTCQYKLQKNQQIGNSGKGTHTWLSGLLKCAKCGYSLKVLKEDTWRWLVCSGRYNLARCDAKITINVSELEEIVAGKISEMLESVPEERVAIQAEDPYEKQLEELDRRADRLMDAFAESCDLSSDYLRRALTRIENERQMLVEARRREQGKVAVPENIDFYKLSFEDKKSVAAQFIRRIEVEADAAEIVWSA